MTTTTKTEYVNWDTIILKNMIQQLNNTLDTLEKSRQFLQEGDNEKALIMLNIAISDIKPYVEFLKKAL
jgi:hypothetical protein